MTTLLAVTPNPSVDRLWHIPGFRTGSLFRVVESRSVAGGKGCNVARVATQLGSIVGPKGSPVQVIATGFLAGSAGGFVERELARCGVRPAFARLASGETRSCPTIVNPETGEVTEIIEPGPSVSPADVRSFEGSYEALLREALAGSPPVVVTLSGSLPPDCPPDIYARLINAAKRLGVPSVLDASGPPLGLGIEAAPWAVKVNQVELAAVFPGDPLAGLAEANRRGVSFAVVTRGREGLLASDGRNTWEGTLPGPLDVVHSVGSGDSATAALALAMLAGGGPEDLIRHMVAAGAANSVTEGIGNTPPEIFLAMRERAVATRL